MSYSKFKISNYYFAKRDTYNTRDVLLIQHNMCKTNMKINVQDESRTRYGYRCYIVSLQRNFSDRSQENSCRQFFSSAQSLER